MPPRRTGRVAGFGGRKVMGKGIVEMGFVFTGRKQGAPGHLGFNTDGHRFSRICADERKDLNECTF
jgi:hypothetical protein